MSSEADAHNSTDPSELWKEWNETTTGMWSSLLERRKEVNRDPFGLYHFWMKPMAFFRQRNDTTSGMWMRLFGEMMNPTWFLEANCQFIEISMNMVRASQIINEMMFQRLQMPTHSDIARVTKLVDSLEERVYTIEDAFVNVEDGYSRAATDQVAEGLAGRLECVEGKLDALDARSSPLQQNEAIGNLAKRLEQVEGKLNMILTALEKIEARADLESGESGNGDEAYRKLQKQCDEI